jgi:hypothetical protein
VCASVCLLTLDYFDLVVCVFLETGHCQAVPLVWAHLQEAYTS